jgi:hypothetical protein
MTAKHCLAFLTDVVRLPWPTDLEPIEVDGVFAVLGPRPPRLRVTRRAMLKDAVIRMTRLEELMTYGTVLPALADVTLTPEQARIALRANHAVLRKAAEQLRGKVQFQLTVRWDEPRALAHFQTSPGPFGIPKSIDDLAQGFQHWVDHLLERLGAETLALPVAAGVAVNRAVLLPVGLTAQLDSLTETVDAIWSEGLSIRLTGPSPGVSFASIALRPVQPSALQDALGSLGVKPGATLDEIQAARRRALLTSGPAAAARIARQVDILRLASAAGWPNCAIPELSLWSEDRASPEPLQGAA